MTSIRIRLFPSHKIVWRCEALADREGLFLTVFQGPRCLLPSCSLTPLGTVFIYKIQAMLLPYLYSSLQKGENKQKQFPIKK